MLFPDTPTNFHLKLRKFMMPQFANWSVFTQTGAGLPAEGPFSPLFRPLMLPLPYPTASMVGVRTSIASATRP